MTTDSSEFTPRRGSHHTIADPVARPDAIEAEALVVFLTEGGAGSGSCAEIDRATGGLLSRLVSTGDLSGKRFECVPILAPPGLRAAQLLVVGLGKREDLDAGTLYRAAATATRQLAGRARSRAALVADATWSTRQVEQAVAGGAVGMVGQDLYRAEKKRTAIGTTVWLGAPPEAVERGAIIGDGVNLARRLVNTAPDDLYPQTFAEEAAAVAGRTGMEVTIWDEEQLVRERCRAILAVGRGSHRPPRLVVLRYRGDGRVNEEFQGTKGYVKIGEITDYKGNVLWKFEGKSDNPYQVEHDELHDAIRNDKPLNNAYYGTTSSFSAVLGRTATYSGKQVGYDELMKTGFRTMPEALTWDTVPPVVPDKDGNYPLPMPATYKVEAPKKATA